MKVLYYSPHPHLNLSDPAGYGTHMREMIAAFERQGCQVLPVIMGGIADDSKNNSRSDKKTWKETIKKVTGKKIWRSLKDIRLMQFDRVAEEHLEACIKEFRPDVIYERANYFQISGVKSVNKNNVPHVLEVNGPYVDEKNFLDGSSGFFHQKARKREELQLKQTSLVVTVSSALTDYFSERYNIARSKFLVLPNAFDPEAIETSAQNQKRIKTKYGLKERKVIGFVGSIFQWHRLDLLIKAFDELTDPETKLLIVGYGDYVAELKEMAAGMARRSDIIFTDKVPKSEVFDYIDVMDICTAPGAAWYQSPIKIFEYGAMAKPVIAPNTLPVKEIMTDGKEGVLVKSAVDSLLEGLNYILSNAEKAKKMAACFQQKIFDQYTWDHNAERVLQHMKKNYTEKI